METAMKRQKYIGYGPHPPSVPKRRPPRREPDPPPPPPHENELWDFAKPGFFAVTFYQGRFQCSPIVGHTCDGRPMISTGPDKKRDAAVVKPQWIIEDDGQWQHVESGGRVTTHGEALLISMCENLR
jgi:hypothetical protein